MVLRVEFDQFPQTVKRLFASDNAYVSAHGRGSLLTATDNKSSTLVICHHDANPEETILALKETGMDVFPGAWSHDGTDIVQSTLPGVAYIAAVAYDSEESKPGLWVDAFLEEPTLAEVMRTMYDEFVANGEMPADISLEEFIRLANPNVVIISPEQIGNYVQAKVDC